MDKMRNIFNGLLLMTARGDSFLSTVRADISDNIEAALKAGSDVILHSPPEYGKSSILHRLQDHFWKKGEYCYDDDIVLDMDHVEDDIVTCMESEITINADTFPEYMGTLDKALGERGKKLYVLLDESEPLFEKENQERRRQLGSYSNIRLCMALDDEYFNLLDQSDLQGYSIFGLEPYTREETAQVLRDGSQGLVDEEVSNKIYTLTKGLPRAVSFLASNMIDRYRENLYNEKPSNMMDLLRRAWNDERRHLGKYYGLSTKWDQ